MSTSAVKVLITGADGFIGSHLTEEALRRGLDVRAMVMYNSFGHWGWLDNSEDHVKDQLDIFPADIRDPHLMKKAVAGVQIVFHLASLIGIPYSYHAPDSYVDTNITGTLNLLQAALDEGVQRFIHTSTSEVYGSAQYVPIDENHPTVGQSPYAASKIAADQMAGAFHRSFGLPVTVVRPFNTYGPRQSTRAIIPTIVTQIASGKDEISLGSLSPRRDLTFVDDTVSGFLAAMESERVAGRTVNLGSGVDISVGELVEKISTLMDRKVTVATDTRRVRPEQSEVSRLLCDNNLARELLGWTPRTSLDDGLARTIDWLTDKRNLAGYRADRYTI